MLLHIFWIIPALIFAFSFWREPRRMLNAYLLAFTLIIMAGVLAGVSIVFVEVHGNQDQALLIAMALLVLLPTLSIILSTLYLLFNGKQMMTFEGRRLANLLSLLYGLGILVAMGLHFLPHHPILSQLVSLLDTLLVYGSFLYLSHMIYSAFYNAWPIRKQPDYIIVLGSGLIGDKVPPLLAQRLDKGLALFEKFKQEPIIIVSGGQGADEKIPEALAMAQYLWDKGLAKDKLLIEDQSTTTYENLTFSRNLIPPSSRVLVVTNSFHALRAGIYMRRIGMPGRSVGSKTALYFLPSALIREDIGLFVMYWKWHALFLGLLLFPWIATLLRTIINIIVTLFTQK